MIKEHEEMRLVEIEKVNDLESCWRIKKEKKQAKEEDEKSFHL